MIKEKVISRAIEIIQSYNPEIKIQNDYYILKDMDINGSDPLVMIEELENEFKIDVYNELNKGIEYTNLKIFGFQIYSKKYEYVDDIKVIDLINIIISKIEVMEKL